MFLDQMSDKNKDAVHHSFKTKDNLGFQNRGQRNSVLALDIFKSSIWLYIALVQSQS